MSQTYINQLNMNELGHAITVKDLKRLLSDNKLADDTPLLMSADEEGNRFGVCYEATVDNDVTTLIRELGTMGIAPEIPAHAKAVLVLMPAI